MKLELDDYRLTDREKEVIAEALEYMINNFGYYEPEEDSYCNDCNHCFKGDYIRDLREVGKKFINPNEYKEIMSKVE